jgi:beta-glucosidase
MTVLRNDGTLPLTPDGRVALVGRLATETTCMGGGSAQVRAPYQVSIEQGLTARLGDRVTVADGVAVRSRVRPAPRDQLTDPVTGAPGVRVRLYGQSGGLVVDEVREENVYLYGIGEESELVTRAELRAVVPAGAQTVGFVGVGEWTLRVGDATDTVVTRVETTDVGEALLRPAGWERAAVLETPTEIVAEALLTAPGGHGAVGIAARPTRPSDDDAIRQAVQAAGTADVAVVVVGLTEEQETEAVDKTTLRLPGRQDDLVAAVAAAARRTVVVVNAATPVLMPWRDDVDAILVAGIPGQEGGHAVAAALLNEIEPAGRLVTTFPVADGATPAWTVEPTDGVLSYDEETFVGYRGHAAGRAPAPAYWFGEGLGYGDFTYGPAAVRGRIVTVQVTNKAPSDSREVVQVYYDPRTDEQPVRLVGWSSAVVPSGEAVDITVECDERLWRTWDTAAGQWRQLAGGELLVARGLGDIRHRLSPT